MEDALVLELLEVPDELVEVLVDVLGVEDELPDFESPDLESPDAEDDPLLEPSPLPLPEADTFSGVRESVR